MEVGIDLKDVLENMGIKRIFDSSANPLSELSHIGLHIGAAVHKGNKFDNLNFFFKHNFLPF